MEQVRRTKISERMRKLQDLVPNMDTVRLLDLPLSYSYFHLLCSMYLSSSIDMQQTNTADMLDLAVQYIKDLQEQVKVMFSLAIYTNIS